MSSNGAKEQVRLTGRKAAGHSWFHHLARIGLAGRGVIYVLIGVLAVQVAFGSGGGEADQKGALATVVGTPGGKVVLWVIVVGFAGLALWQYAEALYGQPVPGGHKPRKRLTSLGRAIVYTATLAGTLGFALGSKGKSSDQQSQSFTAKAMGEPGGRWLVLAIGIAIAAVGVVMLFKAVRRKFLEELKTEQMSRQVRRVATIVGVTGQVARALVFGGIGTFLIYAAVTFDAGKAKGLDGTLRKFADTPAGPWLLVAVAAGLTIFGVYSFFEARWRKVEAVNT
ncbi:DUF1206 domain-containing protein [Actinomadura logoneensis]|uniref:DUF1206 domain-containing protein n=1 Tax=Actinomadura logoneensis TaxID=2293572 RepID=A0A372JDV0_9ACTN|nr:DUF1206 domain-containing protein [Actinomadura logoneensis]RFU38024.1 DUF1206 domain-containing protein [Actinomadura logoneensis]